MGKKHGKPKGPIYVDTWECIGEGGHTTDLSGPTYRQCSLERGNSRLVSWVPIELAIPDKPLKVAVDGVWEFGWVVKTVYDFELCRGQVRDLSNAWKYWRDLDV